MRIIALGGTGDMGSEGVRTLAQIPDVDEVMVTNIDLEAAQALAAELGEDKIKTCRVGALIARGEIARPGAYGPENLIDPVPFFDELERGRDIHVDAHET